MTVSELRKMLATLPQDAVIQLATPETTVDLSNGHFSYTWLESENAVVIQADADEEDCSVGPNFCCMCQTNNCTCLS